MTGYESKKAMAQDKLAQPAQEPTLQKKDSREDYYKRYDDLYVVYLNGVYDGKKAALAEAERGRERNFCERCGKRTKDIHTCTPPQETI